MPLDHSYVELKNQVIKSERRILKELGFCVHVKHPHKVTPLVPQASSELQVPSFIFQKSWPKTIPRFFSYGLPVFQIIVMYLKWLEQDTNRELLQMSW